MAAYCIIILCTLLEKWKCKDPYYYFSPPMWIQKNRLPLESLAIWDGEKKGLKNPPPPSSGLYIYVYFTSHLSFFAGTNSNLIKFKHPLSANRPCSIYQYWSMATRLSGQICKFFEFLLSLNSQKRLSLDTKKTTVYTKNRSFTWKPRSHVRILIYRTWPIVFMNNLLTLFVIFL